MRRNKYIWIFEDENNDCFYFTSRIKALKYAKDKALHQDYTLRLEMDINGDDKKFYTIHFKDKVTKEIDHEITWFVFSMPVA